jgi:hypothetical protein
VYAVWSPTPRGDGVSEKVLRIIFGELHSKVEEIS